MADDHGGSRWPSMFNDGKRVVPTDFVTLLTAVLDGLPKLAGARCRGLPAVFEATDTRDLALALCASCPALGPCREWALSQPRSKLSGVIGGMVYSRRVNGGC